jgi:hypothetical protein
VKGPFHLPRQEKEAINMMVINLTPHEVVLVREDWGVSLSFPASGTVARCDTLREEVDRINLETPNGGRSVLNFPITSVVFGDVTGLPDTVPGTRYIVSSLVAQALPGRTDLLVPDDTLRDNHGRIIGCRALSRIGGAI